MTELLGYRRRGTCVPHGGLRFSARPARIEETADGLRADGANRPESSRSSGETTVARPLELNSSRANMLDMR